MRLLLDTHVALWAIAADRRLPRSARDLIRDSENDVYVSAATVWEISIKHALGTGRMPISGAAAHDYFEDAGYISVPISSTHASAVEGLPRIHGDPFDRIIVAQSIVEPFRLVTHDETVASYHPSIILV
ncbi:MAG: type II toxin-antitoxin system VapC family toxin [Deltaproteobacteria bacterium]|nr:type II toxin-antitoxin system VapC family toxin [Deltaproteobacteria bacterium]